jgi:hypothetical protein
MKIAKILTKIAAVCLASCLVVSFAKIDYKEHVDIWYKVSTDELSPGELIAVDMSKGYSFASSGYIYIIATDAKNGEQITIVFPDGAYWEAPSADEFLMELQSEFDSLEEYLKSKEGTLLKKD